MDAAVGDRIVVAAAMLSGPLRDGEIIEVGSHGKPPYRVRWSDDGRETLFFPGPGAQISHHELPESEAATTALAHKRRGGESAGASVSRQELACGSYLFEQDATTTAHAVLHTGATTELDSRGETHRNPRDADVPEIGDEVGLLGLCGTSRIGS